MAALDCVLLCCLFARPSFAAEAPPTARYDVEIKAPGTLARTLRADLDLLRWRLYQGMSRDLLDRLVDEAQAQLEDMLAAEGYFSPVIAHSIEGEAAPWMVRFEIDPGAAALVSEVRITLVGTLVNEPARAERGRALILERWPLPEGARFRQQDWDLAKRRAVAVVAADRFASASLVSSRATIDPVTHTAQLEVEIDSGPGFRFGEVEVSGLVRYPPSMVRNLAPFTPGDPFDQAALDLFQRRLTATGHFSAVQVELDNDPTRAAGAPVRVSVIEGNSRRFDAGVGYSTDTLYSARIGYVNNDFRGLGWRLRNDARLESRSARATSTLTLPARTDGWQNGYTVRYEQSDISGLELQEGSVAFIRTAINERRQPQWSLSAHVQEQKPVAGDRDLVAATFAAFRYTLRATDDLLSPNRGLTLSGQIGVAPPGLSTQSFVRGLGQAAAWIPLGRSNTLVLRAQAGAVGTGDLTRVPQSFLFRTGGDTTIRGYAYETIGVSREGAIVGGRLFALGSAEAIHWVSDLWGLAAFYDVGNAANGLSEMKPLLQGAGFGARIRSPLGPLRVDIAYGESTRQVRLHLSIGASF